MPEQHESSFVLLVFVCARAHALEFSSVHGCRRCRVGMGWSFVVTLSGAWPAQDFNRETAEYRGANLAEETRILCDLALLVQSQGYSSQTMLRGWNPKHCRVLPGAMWTCCWKPGLDKLFCAGQACSCAMECHPEMLPIDVDNCSEEEAFQARQPGQHTSEKLRSFSLSLRGH